MGWNEDHRNAVADRWGEKYRESGMDATQFSKRMKKTLLAYGWTEDEVNQIVARAIKKQLTFISTPN